MNATARILRTQQAAVPAAEVVDIRAFELGAKLELDPGFLQPELPFEWSGEYLLEPGEYTFTFHEGPDPEMGLVLRPQAGEDDAARAASQKAAVRLFSEPERRVAPGDAVEPGEHFSLLHFQPAGATTFPLRIAAAGRYALFTQHGPEEFRMTLTRGGQAVAPVHAQAHAAGHTHDSTVSSVGLSDPGALDPKRLNEWMGALLREQGADIFRMKGILHVKGSPNRVVFQGVHMLFDAKSDRPWKPGEARVNQLVFIGRNLDRAALAAGFRSCLA
jgi:G3E family GTPase